MHSESVPCHAGGPRSSHGSICTSCDQLLRQQSVRCTSQDVHTPSLSCAKQLYLLDAPALAIAQRAELRAPRRSERRAPGTPLGLQAQLPMDAGCAPQLGES